MPSALRRLAADHSALHEALPPNYLFPHEDASGDDLTQLTILLAGPHGTPYANGLWRLHLKMPADYPKSPPKATFRTRIWHPNVEEISGAVCVDTLKRDWRPELTLKDVLVTISCLLIYPNPDSALNSAAGAQLQEDFEGFARQARLMTGIHAVVPGELKGFVGEAKLRGEDEGSVIREQLQEGEGSSSYRFGKEKKVESVAMKKRPEESSQLTQLPQSEQVQQDQMESSDNENEENDEDTTTKENDPSLSPSPVKFSAPPSPRKNAHGKRPLSVLTMPFEPDPLSTTAPTPMETDEDGIMTASEKNIAANSQEQNDEETPQRKSPKLSVLSKGTNSSGRIRDDIFEEASSASSVPPEHLHRRMASGDGKENHTGPKDPIKTTRNPPLNNINNNNNNTLPTLNQPTPSIFAPASPISAEPLAAPYTVKGRAGNGARSGRARAVSGSRKVSGSRQKPRIGIRRL